MSATRSDRSPTAVDALGLKRLSQLTAATEGSSALHLHEWPPPSTRRLTSLESTAVLSLVSGSTPAETQRRERDKTDVWCARPPAGDDSALREQAHGLTQALVEILAGDRTLTQLVRWTSAEVYEQLHHRVQTLATCPRPAPTVDSGSVAEPVRRRRRRPRVASLHVSTPTEGTAEVSARIDHGVRSTAMALRLERRSAARHVAIDGILRRVSEERWLCTAVSWA